MATAELNIPPPPDGFTLDQAVPPPPHGFTMDTDERPAPSMLAVAGNAVAKGVAGTLDMFGNAPTNAFNLGQGVIGAAAEAVGHPEVWADRTYGTPPNLAHKALSAAGLIRPEHEPQGAAQRILDVAVQGGVGMLANPAKGGLEVARNVAMGLVGGGSAAVTKEATGSDLLALAVGMAVPFAANRLAVSGAKSIQTAVGKQTLRDAQAVGFVTPPSLSKPSFVTNRLESIAGKASTLQDATLRNSEIATKLAAKSIGLPESTSITPADIAQVRTQAGKAYQAVADLSPAAAQTLEKLKEARADATGYFKQYERSADYAALKKAKAFETKANMYDNQLQGLTPPELMDQLKAARTLIARTHDVERALNIGDGTVSAQIIGRMLDSGRPLTGELKVIGKFAQAFPRVTRDAAMTPSPSVSGTDAFSSAILGGVGYGAVGGPAGMLAAGLPLLRTPARHLALSNMMKNRLLREPAPFAQTMLKGALIGKSVIDYHDAIEK